MKEIIGKPKLKINFPIGWIVTDEKEKDFSKVFDTVNYKILIRKLEKYGIKHQYIDWVKSYLNSWKQYVCYSEGILMISLILLIIFFDDFTNFLNSIMFAVETNSFYSNSNIEELFEKVNKELAIVTNWCVTNKLSTNTRNKLINKRLGIIYP